MRSGEDLVRAGEDLVYLELSANDKDSVYVELQDQ